MSDQCVGDFLGSGFPEPNRERVLEEGTTRTWTFQIEAHPETSLKAEPDRFRSSPSVRYMRTSVRMACTTEIWERHGEKGTEYTPACLTCAWIGSDGTRRQAVEEAGMHERGERHPWQLAPGEIRVWSPGDRAGPPPS